MDSAKNSFQVQKWLCGFAFLLFFIKLIAWYLTDSVAILSDALESIVNVVAGCIGLYSLYVAAKPRDMDHPYGHGKAEFVSAASEGLMVLAAGALIVYHAVATFLSPKVVTALDNGLYLIGSTAVLNYAFGFFCIKRGKRNNSLALQASGKHLQIDAYSTIGIIVGLIVILLTHVYWLDGVIALLMGFLVLYNGYHILRASLAGIMDEADMKLLSELVELLNQNRKPDWIDIHNLRVVKYGSTLHIDCHLTVPYYLSVLEAHQEIHRLQHMVGKDFPENIEFNTHTDPCRPPYSCPICTKEDCPVRKAPFVRKLEWTINLVQGMQQHHN